MRRFASITIVVATALALVATPALADGTWSWPVAGPVLRGFEPPAGPYGPGHRGIDIAAADGTVVHAPAPGVVAFAGAVAGSAYLTLDHGGGLASTYSWVSALLVRKGDVIARGQPIALTGRGDPREPVPNLHFGVKLGDTYVDPMLYLGPLSVSDMIRLAPLPPGFL